MAGWGGADEAACERLVRAVSRRLLGGLALESSALWAGVGVALGKDCRPLWKMLQKSTRTRLAELLGHGDVRELTPPPARMTPLDWLVFDMVLVHSDHDPLIAKQTDRHNMVRPLMQVFWLAQRFNLETVSRSQRPVAWVAATRHYNAQGRQCSVMLLQRRWHELKRATRRSLAAFWNGKAGMPKKARARPPPLYVAVARKFPNIVTSPLPHWRDAVAAGDVVLHDELMCVSEAAVTDYMEGVHSSKATIDDPEEDDDDVVLVESKQEVVEVEDDAPDPASTPAAALDEKLLRRPVVLLERLCLPPLSCDPPSSPDRSDTPCLPDQYDTPRSSDQPETPDPRVTLDQPQDPLDPFHALPLQELPSSPPVSHILPDDPDSSDSFIQHYSDIIRKQLLSLSGPAARSSPSAFHGAFPPALSPAFLEKNACLLALLRPLSVRLERCAERRPSSPSDVVFLSETRPVSLPVLGRPGLPRAHVPPLPRAPPPSSPPPLLPDQLRDLLAGLHPPRRPRACPAQSRSERARRPFCCPARRQRHADQQRRLAFRRAVLHPSRRGRYVAPPVIPDHRCPTDRCSCCCAHLLVATGPAARASADLTITRVEPKLPPPSPPSAAPTSTPPVSAASSQLLFTVPMVRAAPRDPVASGPGLLPGPLVSVACVTDHSYSPVLTHRSRVPRAPTSSTSHPCSYPTPNWAGAARITVSNLVSHQLTTPRLSRSPARPAQPAPPPFTISAVMSVPTEEFPAKDDAEMATISPLETVGTPTATSSGLSTAEGSSSVAVMSPTVAAPTELLERGGAKYVLRVTRDMRPLIFGPHRVLVSPSGGALDGAVWYWAVGGGLAAGRVRAGGLHLRGGRLTVQVEGLGNRPVLTPLTDEAALAWALAAGVDLFVYNIKSCAVLPLRHVPPISAADDAEPTAPKPRLPCSLLVYLIEQEASAYPVAATATPLPPAPPAPPDLTDAGEARAAAS